MDKKQLEIQKHMHKSFAFERAKEDLDSRTMTISFASEVPYLRSFGYEIIDVQSMDLERINNKAQLLFNHDEDEYIGVVEKCWIDGLNRKAYANVRFSKSAFAEQIMNDIKDGIISNVSFGYDCTRAVSLPAINGIEAYKFSVSPYEISFVTIPADFSVGVSRSMSKDENEKILITVDEEANKVEKENEIKELVNKEDEVKNIPEPSKEHEKEETKEGKTEDSEKDTKTTVETLAKENEKNHNININNIQTKKMNKELIEKIEKLSRQFNCLDLGMEAIKNETSFEDFQNIVLQRNLSNHSSPAFGNSSVSEEGAGSVFGKTLKEISNGNISSETRKREDKVCSDFGLLKRSATNSVMLKLDDLIGQKRNVTASNPASAAVLTQEGVDTSYLTALSKELVVNKLGAKIIQANGHSSFRIPTAGVLEDYSDAYKAELEDGQEYEMNLTQSTLTPKTLQIFTRVTREIMQQSPIAIESTVASEMQRALVEAMNKAVLVGPGGSKVTGFFNTTGIQSIAAATPSYALALQMQDIVQDNLGSVNEASSKFLSNYATTTRFASTQQANSLPFVYDMNTGRMAGRDVVKSGLVPDLKLAYGDFSNFVIGIWNGVELSVNPYFFKNGDLLVTATVTFDAKVVRPSAFVIATLAAPTA